MNNKANDNIPDDEMLLAEMIAFCEDKGLQGTQHMLFSTDGMSLGNRERGLATRCCALGALALLRDYHKPYSLPGSTQLFCGNDNDDNWNDGRDNRVYSESLGWAFRNAMDPDMGVHQ